MSVQVPGQRPQVRGPPPLAPAGWWIRLQPQYSRRRRQKVCGRKGNVVRAGVSPAPLPAPAPPRVEAGGGG